MKATRIEEEEWNGERRESKDPCGKIYCAISTFAAVAVSCPSLFFFLSPRKLCLSSSLLAAVSNEVSAIAGKYLQRSSKARFLSVETEEGISEGVKLKRRLGRSNRPTNSRKPNLFSLLRSQSDHHFEPRFSINLESLRLFELKQRREFGQRLEIFLLARNLLEIFFLSITSNPLNLKLHIVNEHLLFYVISSSLFEF